MFKPKKLFDRKNGETRTCNVCSIEFHTMKPINRCKECTNKHNKQRTIERMENGEIPTYEAKKNYPFNTNNGEAVARFHKIQYALRDCKTKEERRAHFAKQLKEIEELGILEWIYDRRDEESKNEKRTKSRKTIKRDFPDTRGMTWDEYTAGLGQDDVDS